MWFGKKARSSCSNLHLLTWTGSEREESTDEEGVGRMKKKERSVIPLSEATLLKTREKYTN